MSEVSLYVEVPHSVGISQLTRSWGFGDWGLGIGVQGLEFGN